MPVFILRAKQILNEEIDIFIKAYFQEEAVHLFFFSRMLLPSLSDADDISLQIEIFSI